MTARNRRAIAFQAPRTSNRWRPDAARTNTPGDRPQARQVRPGDELGGVHKEHVACPRGGLGEGRLELGVREFPLDPDVPGRRLWEHGSAAGEPEAGRENARLGRTAADPGEFVAALVGLGRSADGAVRE